MSTTVISTKHDATLGPGAIALSVNVYVTLVTPVAKFAVMISPPAASLPVNCLLVGNVAGGSVHNPDGGPSLYVISSDINVQLSSATASMSVISAPHVPAAVLTV